MDDLIDIFKGNAQKYNHYSQTNEQNGQKCENCIRKHLSYPYTCNDGWKFITSNEGRGRGSTCLNWTDNKQCDVD